jgi:hypothetical protein
MLSGIAYLREVAYIACDRSLLVAASIFDRPVRRGSAGVARSGKATLRDHHTANSMDEATI